MKDELHFLLQLNGEVFPMDNGYWTKFEVKLVESSAVIPHGIRYSLTLHNAKNQRVFGIDNAHLPKLRKKYGAKKVTWDHQHKKIKSSTMSLILLLSYLKIFGMKWTK